MSQKNLRAIVKKFKDEIIESHSAHGDESIVLKREAIREVCLFLKNDPKMAYNFMMDITAVDYLNREPRFEVVYQLTSTIHKHRLRIRVPLEESDLTIDTISDIWRAANWGEREVWDMYGVKFNNHPDLRRILMYEEFDGHPLRKDYPIQQSQPRLDLRGKERDAIEEFNHYYRDLLPPGASRGVPTHEES